MKQNSALDIKNDDKTEADPDRRPEVLAASNLNTFRGA